MAWKIDEKVLKWPALVIVFLYLFQWGVSLSAGVLANLFYPYLPVGVIYILWNFFKLSLLSLLFLYCGVIAVKRLKAKTAWNAAKFGLLVAGGSFLLLDAYKYYFTAMYQFESLAFENLPSLFFYALQELAFLLALGGLLAGLSAAYLFRRK